MGVTAVDGLPYPEFSDAPDVVTFQRLLAEAVEDTYVSDTVAAATYRTIADSYTEGEVDAKFAARTPSVSFTGAARFHIGVHVGTPAGGGKLIVPHGAGFSPTNVMVTGCDVEAQLTSRKGMAVNVMTDSLGGVNFAVGVWRNDDATAVTSQVRITYIVWN